MMYENHPFKDTTKVSGLDDVVPRLSPEGIAGIHDQPAMDQEASQG